MRSRSWGLVLFAAAVWLPGQRTFASVGCVAAVAAHADSDPMPPGDYLLRVHPELGLHEVLIIEEFPVATGEVTRRYRRQVRSGRMDRSLEVQTARGADWHYAQVAHIPRRVLQVYKDRRGMTLPTFVVDQWDPGVSYINNTHVHAMGLALNRASRGRAEVVKNLLILAAGGEQ